MTRKNTEPEDERARAFEQTSRRTLMKTSGLGLSAAGLGASRTVAESGDATASSLVVHYTFEDGSGTTLTDSSGHGNHGQFDGTDTGVVPEWVPTRHGTAAGFQGDRGGHTGYVRVEHAPQHELSAGTVSIQYRAPEGDGMVLSKERTRWGSDLQGPGLEIGFPTDSDRPNRLHFRLGDGYIQTDRVYTHIWQRITATFGPDGMKLYVDDELLATTQHTVGLTQNDAPLLLGAGRGTGHINAADEVRHPAYPLRGFVADLRIYDRQMTPQEVDR
jgi:hypothetical protein